MQQVKRQLVFGLLGTLMLIMVFAGTALAEPVVSLKSSTTSIKVGDQFDVTVELSGVDQLQGLDLQLSYNQQELEGLALQPGTALAGGFVGANDIAAGLAHLAVGLVNVVTISDSNNDMLVLKFEALKAGNITIQVDSLEVAVPGTEGIPELLSLTSAELTLHVAGSGANPDIPRNPGGENYDGGEPPVSRNPDPGIPSGQQPATIGTPAPANSNQPDRPQRPQGWTPVDVEPGHWARSAIQELVDGGYVSGYEDGSFKPKQEITRAEFLALVTRILGLEGANTTVNIDQTFSDGAAVPAWARGVVASAYAGGLVMGDEQGRFRPNAPISRAEIAAIVIRALGQEDQSKATGAGQQAFTDSSQASWAAGYLGLGKQQGLMTGYEDGSFRPNNLSTRAEAAALVSRMLGWLQNHN